MDCIVLGVAESQTRLSDLLFHFLCATFLLYPFVNRHVGCFHVLAVVNDSLVSYSCLIFPFNFYLSLLPILFPKLRPSSSFP